MRLDQFLRASRLVLRRKIAQELCELGAVTVNGVRARAAREVRVGDCVAVRRSSERLLIVRVTALPPTRQTSKQQAATLYEIISDNKITDEQSGT